MVLQLPLNFPGSCKHPPINSLDCQAKLDCNYSFGSSVCFLGLNICLFIFPEKILHATDISD